MYSLIALGRLKNYPSKHYKTDNNVCTYYTV
jgi:hypothetical protein